MTVLGGHGVTVLGEHGVTVRFWEELRPCRPSQLSSQLILGWTEKCSCNYLRLIKIKTDLLLNRPIKIMNTKSSIKIHFVKL